MNNKFFFITSYDSTSGSVLSTILNTHSDIECKVSYPDPFLPAGMAQDETSPARIDEIINSSFHSNKKFIGNAQQFSAFELQTKTLVERTTNPYRCVNIIVSPEKRVNLILQSWLESGLSEAIVLSNIQQQMKTLQEKKHSLFSLFIFDYYYHLICNRVKSEKLADLNIPANHLFIFALAKVIAYDSANIPAPGKKFSFEKIISSDVEFITFMNYLTCDKIEITDEFRQQLNSKLDEHRQSIKTRPWQEWQRKLLDSLLHTKLFSVYHPHIDDSLASLYAEAGYPISVKPDNDKPVYNKLISIHINSNRPAVIAAYFDNIEETSDNPEQVEVLINIDTGDDKMKAVLESEIPKRKFTLKYIETPKPKSFCEVWPNGLLKITDPNAYFLLNLSDEMLFATQGWDSILKKYIGYFPDHLFRLRASRNKFRNYFDRWECSFAQDCIPFTTKKWIDIGGNWNPCFGTDSFQQLVAFYLAKEGMFSNTNYLREAPLTEIRFGGDVPMLGIDVKKAWRHSQEHISHMLICQSYKMQLEAKRRAVMIKAHIIAEAMQLKNFAVTCDSHKQQVLIINKETKAIVQKFNYKLNWLAITAVNQWRKLAFFSYFGEGINTRKSMIKGFLQYLKAKHASFRALHRLTMRLRRMDPDNPPARYPTQGEKC